MQLAIPIPQQPEILQSVPGTNRIVKLETNFNNKLSCRAFTHIDLMPAKTPSRLELQGKMIDIHTLDNSHPVVTVNIYDMEFLPMKKVNDWLSWHSHGMSVMQFTDHMFKKYHHRGFSFNTELAIYFYLRCL